MAINLGTNAVVVKRVHCVVISSFEVHHHVIFLRKTGSDISTTLIQGFNFTNSRFQRIQLHEFTIQLHEFTNSTSGIPLHEFNLRIHEFNFMNHEFNFTNSTSRIQLHEFRSFLHIIVSINDSLQ